MLIICDYLRSARKPLLTFAMCYNLLFSVTKRTPIIKNHIFWTNIQTLQTLLGKSTINVLY